MRALSGIARILPIVRFHRVELELEEQIGATNITVRLDHRHIFQSARAAPHAEMLFERWMLEIRRRARDIAVDHSALTQDRVDDIHRKIDLMAGVTDPRRLTARMNTGGAGDEQPALAPG